MPNINMGDIHRLSNESKILVICIQSYVGNYTGKTNHKGEKL
jgi:hypothetical protein